MRNSKNSRANNKVRAPRPQRVPERITDGVYSNNYFMHAATSHIGTLVKVETVQGAIYEGIFKTFSHDFDVVLELAHKVDNADPQKLNAQEVVECLIFHSKDIVYMCAQNIEPNYAVKGSFQIDSNISKYNGEIAGEKKLQPWEGPPVCNGEECDLEASDNSRNGWDVHEMFLKNEQFGVQTSYDDSLADYTCQIHRKDTKDFREEEAKAARIAMEIERNPSSQARASLENGENEEELFAAVSRTGNEADEKYVPPPMKRKSSQHHRAGGGGSRGQYPANARLGSDSLSPHNTYPPRVREPRINGQIMENHAKRHNRPPPLNLRETARGNQRSYNVPESPGRQQMNSSASLSRYHHQSSQQYHQQQPLAHGNHAPQTIRDNTNRSSPENKNAPLIASNVTQQAQNIPSYSANINQRTFSQNVVPVSNHAHSQNVSVQQQSKSQRTSPVSMSSLPNGNADYQSKQLPPVSQPPPHQYHNQTQQSQNNINNVGNQQRKHHHHQQHHHSNTKVREDQINELKKFGSDFNLSYEMKTKESEAPKPIQVVSTRNKSPPVSQAPTERNVVPVSIVATLQPNKYTTVAVSTQQSMGQPVTTQPPSNGAQAPAGVSAAAAAAIKTHPHVLSQQPTFQQAQHQHMHLQQREAQVLMQHPAHLPQSPHLSHHQQSLPPKTQPQKGAHSVPLHQNAPLHQTSAPPPPVLTQGPTQPPTAGQLPPQHPAVTTQQSKTVINSQVQSVQNMHSVVPQQNASQSVQQQTVSSQHQTSGLPPNVHQRPPLQQQPSQKGNNSSSATQSPTLSDANAATETDSVTKCKEEEDEVLDEVASTLKKSTLNPNAKEFVYNPAAKPFTPASRSPSTPTQSRPHTPQTPSNYSIHPGNAPVATGIQMVMPTYVVAASPGYVQPPPATSRLRKVPVNSHRTPEFHPSNIPVSAVTGQPLLAPSVTLAPSPLGHGTSFPVPAYPHHPQLAAHQYPHVQMIRMVQQGSMVPLVPSTISYHDTAGTNAAAAVYVNHGSGAAMAMAPHTQHVHHTQQHPPPSTAPSPSQTPQGPSQSHAPNGYQHPSLATQSAPPYQPIVCPVIQAPPTHAPPHHMVAQSQQHTMQQYLQHQQVQPSHIQVSLLPHSS